MRIDLMPQWIAHYRALGAERFLLTLQTEPDLADSERVRVRARFTAMLAANGIDNPHFQVTPFNATALRNSHDALQRQHAKATDWIVWSDADEFQLYPAPPPDLAAWAGKYDINLFRGVLIDRVAADGGLPHGGLATFGLGAIPGRVLPSDAFWRRRAPEDRARARRRHAVERQSLRECRAARADDRQVDAGPPLQVGRDGEGSARVPPAAGIRDHSRNWIESQRSLDYFEAHGGHFDPDDLKPLELPARDFIDWVGSGYQKNVPAPQAIATSDAVFSLQPTAVAQTQRKSKF